MQHWLQRIALTGIASSQDKYRIKKPDMGEFPATRIAVAILPAICVLPCAAAGTAVAAAPYPVCRQDASPIAKDAPAADPDGKTKPRTS